MPHAYMPDYALWSKEFERFEISDSTILVGHSCGGGFLVRWLSENPKILVNNVILVAPWLDPENTKRNDFFNFTIDAGIGNRARSLVIFNSTNDMKSVRRSVETLVENVPLIGYKEFQNYGHFCRSDLNEDRFPELLAEVIKK